MEDPLLLSYHSPSSSSSSSSSSSLPLSAILTRISTFLLLLSLALYANIESSKSFRITVLKPVSSSPAARCFDLLFVSTGLASRTIHTTSTHIHSLLYPNTTLYPPKPVRHVILHLATHDLHPQPLTVQPGSEPGQFLLSLSPSLVMETDARAAMERALRRGMARVWVWDAPDKVVDEVVEGLMDAGGDPVCWAEVNRELMEGKGALTGILRRLCKDNDLDTSAETGHVS